MLEHQRFARLQHLLDKSNIFCKFLLQRMEEQKLEEMKKFEKQSKKEEKDKEKENESSNAHQGQVSWISISRGGDSQPFGVGILVGKL